MSVIIISSDSYPMGIEMARSTAESLGYALVTREILGSVADRYRIPEEKLLHSLDEYPSFFRTSSRLWKRYLAYIQEATLAELVKGDTVCQGLAAHLYVLGVSHVLRIRILSDPEKRIQQLKSREGMTHEKVRKLLEKERKFRRRWSVDAFGPDETDPSRYDLVINLGNIDPDEAVKLIGETVSYRRFKPMTYSIKCLKDLELASRVRAALVERFPDVRVRANSGTMIIETTALKREKKKRSNLIREIAGNIPGVQYVEVHVINDIFRQAIESYR